MSVHNVQFPVNISYGSRGGIGYKTTVVELDSGAEQRISRWSVGRHRYDVSYGIKSHDDLSTLKNFFMARMGAAFGFRYKDWSDFTSNPNHRGAPSSTDQMIGIGDGTRTTFQLIKTYPGIPYSRTRKISYPVSGTVKIAFDGVDQTTGWTVNTTTGVVTFTVPPAAGVVVTAGYEFDVPVRFETTNNDEVLMIDYESVDSGSIPSIFLVEIMDEDQPEEEFYYGGATRATFNASFSTDLTKGRVQIWEPLQAGLYILLPPHESLPMGGPYFYFANASDSFSYEVRKSDNTLLKTVDPGAIIHVVLGVDTLGNTVWYSLA